MPVICPIELGIVPVRPLPPRYNSVIFVICPIGLGVVPFRPFLLKSIKVMSPLVHSTQSVPAPHGSVLLSLLEPHALPFVAI
jgi:hypothetical protein